MSGVQVVVLNGPAGVGKTTVRYRLAAGVSNGACIHGDALRGFVVTRAPERPTGLSYVGAAALTQVYAAAGFDRVVVDYVMEGTERYDRFLGALPADLAAGTRLFTL